MNQQSIFEKIRSDLIPALLSGGISLGIYSLVFGEKLFGDSIPFFGMAVPGSIVVAGAVAGSHLIGNVLENNILTMFESQSHATLMGRIAKPLIAGVASTAIFKIAVNPETNITESFILGAGSVFASSYVYDTFLGNGRM